MTEWGGKALFIRVRYIGGVEKSVKLFLFMPMWRFKQKILLCTSDKVFDQYK